MQRFVIYIYILSLSLSLLRARGEGACGELYKNIFLQIIFQYFGLKRKNIIESETFSKIFTLFLSVEICGSKRANRA